MVKHLHNYCKQPRICDDRQRPTLTSAKRISLRFLMQGLLHAAKIDRIIKGVAQGDVWDELLQLGLRFNLYINMTVEKNDCQLTQSRIPILNTPRLLEFD